MFCTLPKIPVTLYIVEEVCERGAFIMTNRAIIKKLNKNLKGKCLKSFHWIPAVLEVDGVTTLLFVKGDIQNA